MRRKNLLDFTLRDEVYLRWAILVVALLLVVVFLTFFEVTSSGGLQSSKYSPIVLAVGTGSSFEAFF